MEKQLFGNFFFHLKAKPGKYIPVYRTYVEVVKTILQSRCKHIYLYLIWNKSGENRTMKDISMTTFIREMDNNGMWIGNAYSDHLPQNIPDRLKLNTHMYTHTQPLTK